MHRTLFPTRATSALAAIVVIALSSACSGDKRESAGDVARDSVAAPAAAVAVADIDVGRTVSNAQISDKTTEFKPADTVYTSIHTTGSAANTTLMARWTFEDGQTVQESSQTIAPTGDAYTEFHISKPGGLPTGKYKVEVFLDGRSVGAKDFEVK